MSSRVGNLLGILAVAFLGISIGGNVALAASGDITDLGTLPPPMTTASRRLSSTTMVWLSARLALAAPGFAGRSPRA
jgi:hypothetical protein